MAFAGIIPENPSFGQLMGRAAGAGAAKGLSAGLEKGFEINAKKSLIKDIEDPQPASSGGFTDEMVKEFTEGLQEYENATGKQLTPQDIEPLWNKFMESQPQIKKTEQPQNPNIQNKETASDIPEKSVKKLRQEARDFAKAGYDSLARQASSQADSIERKESSEKKLGLEKEKFAHTKSVAEQAAIDKSYDAQEKFINETTGASKGFKSEMRPRLLQMQALNDEELIGSAAATFLEKMDIPLGVLENPSNELYNKLSQDLLKGLPETYGNRILKVEVDNFLRTIPQLINSPEGRRLIAANMLKLGEMKDIFYNEMRKQQIDYLDRNVKFPKDFEQRIFDNVQPQLEKFNDEFIKLSSIKSVPEGTIPFFDPQGNVSFVPKDPKALEWAMQNGGKRIW